MKNVFKRSLFVFILLGVFVFSTVASATSDLTVNGGSLVLNSNVTSATLSALTEATLGTQTTSASGIGFGSVTIFMATTIAPISKTDNVRIDDNRGTAVGWNNTVSASDLTATVVDHTTATPDSNVTIAIPANTILTVAASDPTAINSSDLTNVTKQGVDSAVTNTGVKVTSSGDGYGAGSYLQALGYTLTVPNYLPLTAVITPTDLAGSKFADRAVGSKMPLLAGVYSTTITYATTTGP